MRERDKQTGNIAITALFSLQCTNRSFVQWKIMYKHRTFTRLLNQHFNSCGSKQVFHRFFFHRSRSSFICYQLLFALDKNVFFLLLKFIVHDCIVIQLWMIFASIHEYGTFCALIQIHLPCAWIFLCILNVMRLTFRVRCWQMNDTPKTNSFNIPFRWWHFSLANKSCVKIRRFRLKMEFN